MCFAPQWRALFWHLNVKKWSEPVPFLHFWLGSALRTKGRALFRHLNFQKCSGADVLNTCSSWTCASRHIGVHFFDISTSRSALELTCLIHVHLEMCSRTTTACTFSTCQFPKVVWEWCALYIVAWKRASRFSLFLQFLYEIELWLQSRAHFVDLILKKWSEPIICLTIFMWNRALATVECTFCRPHLEKVARTRQTRPNYLMMMWLTLWCGCHDGETASHWQSSVTRKFPN